MPRDDKGLLDATVPTIKSFATDLNQMEKLVKDLNENDGNFMDECEEIIESLLIHFEANYQLLDKEARRFIRNSMFKLLFVGIKAAERAFLPDIGGR